MQIKKRSILNLMNVQKSNLDNAIILVENLINESKNSDKDMFVEFANIIILFDQKKACAGTDIGLFIIFLSLSTNLNLLFLVTFSTNYFGEPIFFRYIISN